MYGEGDGEEGMGITKKRGRGNGTRDGEEEKGM